MGLAFLLMRGVITHDEWVKALVIMRGMMNWGAITLQMVVLSAVLGRKHPTSHALTSDSL